MGTTDICRPRPGSAANQPQLLLSIDGTDRQTDGYYVSAYYGQGCSPKKKLGAPETRLRQRFLNNLGLHTRCTEIILHCVSESNQLQQWTNLCTNISPKKWGVGDASPLSKKVERRRPPASPPHYAGLEPNQRVCLSAIK